MQKTVTKLVDDLNGEDMDEGEGQTVDFGLDGVGYEIDLFNDQAEDLRAQLKEYIANGRRTGGRKQAGRAPKVNGGGQSRYSRETSAHQREWARSQGFTVSDRGRLPGDAIAAWEQAHPTQVA